MGGGGGGGPRYLLRLYFILGLINFIIFLYWGGIVIYDYEFETKKDTVKPLLSGPPI